MMLAAAIAGALMLLGPALMKNRLGVDEVVTTLLINFIVLLGVSALLDGPMKDPTAMGWPQSVSLQSDLELGKLVAQTRVHTGLLWAVSLAVMVWAIFKYTVLGFDIRAVGANARAALITRGLTEMRRLSEALGGKPETVMGLAGIGDLVLTCTDNQSRNRQVGLAVGKGRTLQETLAAFLHNQ